MPSPTEFQSTLETIGSRADSGEPVFVVDNTRFYRYEITVGKDMFTLPKVAKSQELVLYLCQHGARFSER